jgi:hypothetical protein
MEEASQGGENGSDVNIREVLTKLQSNHHTAQQEIVFYHLARSHRIAEWSLEECLTTRTPLMRKGGFSKGVLQKIDHPDDDAAGSLPRKAGKCGDSST